MKVRTVTFLSVIALISIVVIQLAGMFYACTTRLKDTEIELEKCFWMAYNETVDNIVNNLPYPNGTVVHIAYAPDLGKERFDRNKFNKVGSQQMALALQTVYGVKEIPLTVMDSVLHNKWRKTGLEGKIAVERFNTRTGEVLESTNPDVHPGFLTVISESAFIAEPRNEAFRAIVSFPSKEIIEKVLVLFFITLLFLFVAVNALLVQLKSLFYQRRSLQEQQQDFYLLAEEMRLPVTNIRKRISDEAWENIEESGTALFNRTEKTLTKAKIEAMEQQLEKTEHPDKKFPFAKVFLFRSSSKRVALLSLVGVFLLLGVWAGYLYHISAQKVKLQAEEKLENAFFNEAIYHRYRLFRDIHTEYKEGYDYKGVTPYAERLWKGFRELYKKGYRYHTDVILVYHVYNKFDENFQMHAAYSLQDSINNISTMPIPFSLQYADSAFNSGLAEAGFPYKGSIHWLKYPSGELLHYTGTPTIGIGDISTKLIPLNEDSTTCIKGVLRQPQKAVLGGTWYMLVPLGITFLFICSCVFFLIRLLKMQRRLKQFQKEFTYSMIHDMKSPLQSITMGAHILSSGKLSDKPDKKQRYIQAMTDECEHLLALSNRVVMLTQIDQGELELHKEAVDVKSLFMNLTEKFRLRTAKPVHFKFESEGSDSVLADAFCLHEVLSNLIDNAIKYSGEEVTITLFIQTKDGDTLIKVRDNGIGIPLREQKKIFERFERVSSNSRKSGASGFGLGLNYVMRVMEAHGGTISVESVEGKYSEFTLCFPKE